MPSSEAADATAKTAPCSTTGPSRPATTPAASAPAASMSSTNVPVNISAPVNATASTIQNTVTPQPCASAAGTVAGVAVFDADEPVIARRTTTPAITNRIPA